MYSGDYGGNSGGRMYEDPRNLIINYIPNSIMDAELRGMFEIYGEVESARVILDRVTSAPKGYGFVKFKKEDCARTACEALNGREMDGKRLKVTMAKGPNHGGRGYDRDNEQHHHAQAQYMQQQPPPPPPPPPPPMQQQYQPPGQPSAQPTIQYLVMNDRGEILYNQLGVPPPNNLFQPRQTPPQQPIWQPPGQNAQQQNWQQPHQQQQHQQQQQYNWQQPQSQQNWQQQNQASSHSWQPPAQQQSHSGQQNWQPQQQQQQSSNWQGNSGQAHSTPPQQPFNWQQAPQQPQQQPQHHHQQSSTSQAQAPPPNAQQSPPHYQSVQWQPVADAGSSSRTQNYNPQRQ